MLHKSFRCFVLFFCYAETPDKLQLAKHLFTKHRGNAVLPLHHLLPATHNLDMVPLSLGREAKMEGLGCNMCMWIFLCKHTCTWVYSQTKVLSRLRGVKLASFRFAAFLVFLRLCLLTSQKGCFTFEQIAIRNVSKHIWSLCFKRH